MLLRVVSFVVNDFSCSLPRDSVVKAILYHRIEVMRRRGVLVVVDATLGIDVCDLLPDASLACTYRTDPLQKLFEVILTECSGSLLESIVIEDEAFSDIFTEYLGSPLAEARGVEGIDAVAYGDDRIKIVEVNLSFDCAFPLQLNYFLFGNSCLLVQLSFFKYVLEVLTNSWGVDVKERCHSLLGKP